MYGQLENATLINSKRLKLWNQYFNTFTDILPASQLPSIPENAEHNAHMFYIKLTTPSLRADFIQHMKQSNIITPFHYVPLHTSPAGLKYGRFCGYDTNTSTESLKLVRLPLYFNMSDDAQSNVIDNTILFLEKMK